MPLQSDSELAHQATDALATLLEDHRQLLSETSTERADAERVSTFAEEGVISGDPGLIIYLKDGSQIRLTVTAYTPGQA